jgi:energy-coupling factor transporter ATP-binding protein EcfA2
MAQLKQLHAEQFTVFDSIDIALSPGINVFIGENSTGKTHLLKVLYSACQAARRQKTAIDFSAKLVRTMNPDNRALHRLARRRRGTRNAVLSVIATDDTKITLTFDSISDAKQTTMGLDNWCVAFSSLLSTFIPAKEILAHSRNLLQAIDQGNVDFDDTYRDVISAASVKESGALDDGHIGRYLEILGGLAQGRVLIEDERFYLLPGKKSQGRLEFNLVAEGLRKFALLWQLMKNGRLTDGSILFWDEPESNINPRHIPALVDLLLDLQRDGVQIFLATHNYMLGKYLEVFKRPDSQMAFHALYRPKDDETGAVQVESGDTFTLLENNAIVKQNIELYKADVARAFA